MWCTAPSTRAHHRPVLRARNDVVVLPIDYATPSTPTAHIRSTTPAAAHHQQIHLRDVRGHGEVAVSDIREDHTKHIQIHAGVGQTGSGEGQRSRRIGEDRGSGNSGEDRGANYAGAGREGESREVGTADGGRDLVAHGGEHRDVPIQVVGSDGDPFCIRRSSCGVIEAVGWKVGRDPRRIVHHHHTRSTHTASTLITCATTTTARVGRSSGGRKAVVQPSSITAATPAAVDVIYSVTMDRATTSARKPATVAQSGKLR